MRNDVAMPRDVLRRRKIGGYAALCAIGIDAEPGVFRVGAVEDVEVLLSRLQLGTWHDLHFSRLLWTPGIELARTVAADAEKFLSDIGAHLGRHWYRTDLDIIDDLFTAGITKLNAKAWHPHELLARLQTQANREADRFSEGVF
ncbi:hypothetical protein C7441_11078 [Pseudaminobacter salicylatoxidans]|uniref:Uncharacterized protein n=1 Tax=Pseudaminobacter salicylatoxidans TaxID=93369 RepID=A0A316C0K4_PSESE|nr:hypothetical protein [Pseudaminobacter salicylatoxidans]PWJ81546.1 hypothetical protein C7441_11078 [Pseudaminobacter salicylatoxidans]